MVSRGARPQNVDRAVSSGRPYAPLSHPGKPRGSRWRWCARSDDPDDSYSSPEHHRLDREVRWRRYDGQVVKVVVDLADGSIVSVWTTQVRP